MQALGESDFCLVLFLLHPRCLSFSSFLLIQDASSSHNKPQEMTILYLKGSIPVPGPSCGPWNSHSGNEGSQGRSEPLSCLQPVFTVIPTDYTKMQRQEAAKGSVTLHSPSSHMGPSLLVTKAQVILINQTVRKVSTYATILIPVTVTTMPAAQDASQMPSTRPGAFWTLSHLSVPITHFKVE